MEWPVDPDKRIGIQLFAPGYEYKILGIETMNIHLFGLPIPRRRRRLFLLGTDRLGRDQWSRLMYGTRTSMTVGLIAVFLSVILGVLLGGISGYFGGLPDLVIQRMIEILQSLPTIPIWLAMTAALPRTGRPSRSSSPSRSSWRSSAGPPLRREVRGRFLSLREEDFVLAAELAGCSRSRIIMRHMVPVVHRATSSPPAPWPSR